MVDKPNLDRVDAKPTASPSASASAAQPVPASAEAAKPVVAAKVEAPKPVAAKAPVVKPVARKKAAVAKRAIAATSKAAPTKITSAGKTLTNAKGNTRMNDTVTKVQETAQKMTADATARAGEMFGDMSARAKTVMEKGSKGLEEMVEFSKGNLEAVVASGRVAAKGVQDIAKYSAEYGRKSIEDANATAKKFAAVKSPTEFFALQSEVAKSNLDAFVGEASKFTEGYMKLMGEIMQPMQNRYAVAVEKVKTVVAA